MIDRLVDYLDTNKRVWLPILLGATLILVGVIIWRQVSMWLVLLATPHISFVDSLLFYLYVGSFTLFALMPFALRHKINNNESNSGIERPAENEETSAVGRDTQCLRNKYVTENKYNNTGQDGNKTTNKHTPV